MDRTFFYVARYQQKCHKNVTKKQKNRPSPLEYIFSIGYNRDIFLKIDEISVHSLEI